MHVGINFNQAELMWRDMLISCFLLGVGGGDGGGCCLRLRPRRAVPPRQTMTKSGCDRRAPIVQMLHHVILGGAVESKQLVANQAAVLAVANQLSKRLCRVQNLLGYRHGHRHLRTPELCVCMLSIQILQFQKRKWCIVRNLH